MPTTNTTTEECLNILNQFSYPKRAILRRLGLDPEDLVQSVYLVLLRRKALEKFNPEVSTIEKYLSAIAKNVFLDLLDQFAMKRNTNWQGQWAVVASIDEEGEDGIAITDILPAPEGLDSCIVEFLEKIPHSQISKRFPLTWREFLVHVLRGEQDQLIETHGSHKRTLEKYCQSLRDFGFGFGSP